MNLLAVNTVIRFSQRRAKAHEIYKEKFFPYGGMMLGDDRHKDSAEYIEYATWAEALRVFMRELEYKEILDIEALMMLGRGDFDTFEDSQSFLIKRYSNDDPSSKDQAIRYIISKSPLDHYLADGLDIVNGISEKEIN